MCKMNKQMRKKHIDPLSFPQVRRSQCKDWKNKNKEQGRTQQEMPRSKNSKATQNKNNTRTSTLDGR